jgi:transcriptional regulator with XRE-family HTH domain
VAMYLREVCLELAMSALPAAKLETDKPTLLLVGRDYLRKKMRERDTTVTALAEELGISRRHLSNVLNGHAPLLEPLLGRLCQALMIEPSLLVCFLDYGSEPEPASYGAMEGTIEVLADPTEPMEGWEMLEG